MPVLYHDTNTTATELVNDYASLIQGKTILITGPSPGSLGGHYAQSIAKANPACLILAGRNEVKLEQCVKDIKSESPETNIRILKVDLSSLQSARDAATQVNNWDDIPAIDVLVNNAGIMASPHKISVDGFESQFATNHLGPFLFTNLIMKKILESKSPRIVMVSSDGHRLSPIRFSDYNFDEGKTYNRWVAYGQSKTANMLMALSLANKLGVKHSLLAFSLHPGYIFTNLANHLDWEKDAQEVFKIPLQSVMIPLWPQSNIRIVSLDRQMGNPEGWKGDFDMRTPDRGVATHVYASFDPILKANNGAYLINSHIADPLVDTVRPWATSSFEAERLWRLSEKLVGEEFPY